MSLCRTRVLVRVHVEAQAARSRESCSIETAAATLRALSIALDSNVFACRLLMQSQQLRRYQRQHLPSPPCPWPGPQSQQIP